MQDASPASRRVIVSVQNVRRDFHIGGELVRALGGVSLDVYAGEYLSIMGPSGSGKSTLFNMIGGLDEPTEGKVLVHGVEMGQLSRRLQARMRCLKIGYIFQMYNLIPVFTAMDNVALPLLFAGTPREAANERAAAVLAEVGLGERIHHRPDELSGGQQQRVAIARAFANDPSIILADEPTGNLDLKTGEDIIRRLSELSKKKGVTIISATHDHKMLAVSDRVVWIRGGTIERLEERKNLKIQVGDIA